MESFKDYIREVFNPIGIFDKSEKSSKDKELAQSLQNVYLEKGELGIDEALKYAFYGHVVGGQFTETNLQDQREMADLRYPTEWFPGARQLPRKIHLHIGPTNSGKTYHALKRLEECKNGVYAGPLRLLAHEVYSRLNAKGIRCALITGEEQRLPEDWLDEETRGSKAISCTVEMVPLTTKLDVAVIDEIQMLGNEDRGWAWTSALTGVLAKEVHVCGEERALGLVMQIAAAMGEEVTVHRYKRLTPLETERQSLNGDFKKLRKGDCIVTFSVMGIHSLRQEIEKMTGKKVAVVYGSLPPETRAQQARLFNDPDNDYDYLVASDAIGMGLNLSIKRVIFETLQKNNGRKVTTLSGPEIRQIAGRAGRYRTAHQDTNAAETSSASPDKDDQPNEPTESSTSAPDETIPPEDTQALFPTPPEPTPQPQSIGLVTTLDKVDLPLVARAMENPIDTLTSAGVAPPSPIIERFASYFPPGTPFSYILIRLNEICQLGSRYHICKPRDNIAIADAIHGIQGLTVTDKIVLTAAPCNMREKGNVALIRELATAISTQRGGGVLEITSLKLDVLDKEIEGTRSFLKELEELHKGLVLYLWLSFRFPGIFTTRPLATHVKEEVERGIEEALQKMSFDERMRRRERERGRRARLLEEVRRDLLVKGEGVGADGEGEIEETAGTTGQAAEAGEVPVEGETTGESGMVDDEGEYPEEEEIAAGEEGQAELEPFAEETVYEESSAEDDGTAFGLEEGEEKAFTSESSTEEDASHPHPSQDFAAWRARETRPIAAEK
ncbi:P-loop containing nucleoside triphosphate hydrolase protein [Tothia fuscella]|uniref:RNA helicase n=1 Tax=Tothia fuscella TaxID=1048955 RepID=A0A9P4NNV4_9PEZI|nr:P-loop containing nucleoside triphosphate hydrolase protein [Tothia fuscella]